MEKYPICSFKYLPYSFNIFDVSQYRLSIKDISIIGGKYFSCFYKITKILHAVYRNLVENRKTNDWKTFGYYPIEIKSTSFSLQIYHKQNEEHILNIMHLIHELCLNYVKCIITDYSFKNIFWCYSKVTTSNVRYMNNSMES